MTQRNRGMTLLEVLVALAIFATAAISVMKSVTQHINTLSYLEQKTFASLIADNQMSLVMLAGAPTSVKTGKAKMAGREWYWKVSPVDTAVGFIAAFDVSVALDKEVKHPLVTVRSYVEK
ncbi:type II secretion system minor pseudopilin GspI [Vibrio sp. TH_r3]|uniref:type II secretion system minor pseudopilin GspI n=1 Tax=Vibrio sp. TH_r3 TaxID=3082084 RepID=UPI002952CF2B|nr:type II secretion system minor pseudopilin GspI [Vibrio sp. TH_r3]MDV7104151.1 type II secretion system minor pseudopilin GspI [Vibrio sp. TH_r3]